MISIIKRLFFERHNLDQISAIYVVQVVILSVVVMNVVSVLVVNFRVEADSKANLVLDFYPINFL